MTETIQVGDRVKIHLDDKFGDQEGWYEGIVTRIDAYSSHRSFYWVTLTPEAQSVLKMKEISVFNLRNIQKLC